MARRRSRGKNEAGGVAGLLILAGIWLLDNIHYIIPAAIFIAIIVILLMSAAAERKFGLTDEEAAQLRQADEDIQSINSWFAELERSGKNLNRVRDRETNKMRYNERSYLGQEANQQEKKRSDLSRVADELRHDPLDSLKHFVLMWRFRVAARWLALGYAVTVFWSYLFNKQILNTDIFRASAIGLGLSLLAFLITYGLTPDAVDNKLAALNELYKLPRGGEIKPEYMLGHVSDEQSPNAEQKEEDSKPEQETRRGPSSKSENARASRKAWHEILGVPPNASADEIMAAWREKIKKNHPDGVAAMDAEIQEFANQKAQEINMARDLGLSRFRRS